MKLTAGLLEREKGDFLGWNEITGDGGLRFVEMAGCPFASFHAAYSWNVFVYIERQPLHPVTFKNETFFAVIIAVIQAAACIIVLRLDRLW